MSRIRSRRRLEPAGIGPTPEELAYWARDRVRTLRQMWLVPPDEAQMAEAVRLRQEALADAELMRPHLEEMRRLRMGSRR